MDALSIVWLASPLVLYVALIVSGAWWFRRSHTRRLRATQPIRHRVLFATYLALVFTPSVVTDFFLFRIPGPAFLGFLFLIPGTLANMFSRPDIVPFVLRATTIYHIVPLLAGFAVAYLVLWTFDRCRSRSVASNV